jgi:hypothetical protein
MAEPPRPHGCVSRATEAPVPSRQTAVATERPGERDRGRIREAGRAWIKGGKENVEAQHAQWFGPTSKR